MSVTIPVFDVIERKVVIARSSARQLEPRLAEAKEQGSDEISLDFTNVVGVGPSFVDELIGVIQDVFGETMGSVTVRLINPPSRLSDKYLAIGRGRQLEVSEDADGAWRLTRRHSPSDTIGRH